MFSNMQNPGWRGGAARDLLCVGWSHSLNIEPDWRAQLIALRYFLSLAMTRQVGEATTLGTIATTGIAHKSLQPRFSRLRAMKLVELAGARRRDPSSKRAAVLRLTENGRKALRNG